MVDPGVLAISRARSIPNPARRAASSRSAMSWSARHAA